ncbi:MAG: rhodanese-like domain-containing protein [Flavobacteriaceae bacterium]|nr:rhodanese-like domain-containing protein [Flavobacteriaceae bacterium]
MQDLTQSQWREQISNDENAVILDVRTDMEVAEGIIPNAQQINIQNAAGFMQKANDLDKSKNYYIYCKSGGRSAQACMILNSLGFQNTYNLLGGITEWEGETTV